MSVINGYHSNWVFCTKLLWLSIVYRWWLFLVHLLSNLVNEVLSYWYCANNFFVKTVKCWHFGAVIVNASSRVSSFVRVCMHVWLTPLQKECETYPNLSMIVSQWHCHHLLYCCHNYDGWYQSSLIHVDSGSASIQNHTYCNSLHFCLVNLSTKRFWVKHFSHKPDCTKLFTQKFLIRARVLVFIPWLYEPDQSDCSIGGW